MANLILNGSTSGSVTLSSPAVSGTTTLTLPTTTSTLAINGPAFSASASTNQSISSASFTKITFSTENFDTNNNFASSRFTPTVAGYYQISGATRVEASASGEFILSIARNGTIVYRGLDNSLISANQFAGLNVSALLYLNGSTDYVEMLVYQSTGSSKNITGEPEITWMTGFLARSA
jgi:hypothetical protein